MSECGRKILLIGDNPFHGISHLSQERARGRDKAISQIEYATDLIRTSMKHGAKGFMFSVSDTTLSILRKLVEKEEANGLMLYALVPYAYEYMRTAVHVGGISGLAKRFGKEVLFSGNIGAIASGLKGVLWKNPKALLKTYLNYEILRIRSASKKAYLKSILLHEVITDIASALDMKWLFEFYMEFMQNKNIQPGFNTRNFAYLVERFVKWDIDLDHIAIAAPFNKVGFQMCPSRMECEKSLVFVSKAEIIAISILAAGYLQPLEAIEYIAGLPNIRGVAVGVSKEQHANETFKLLERILEG